ncbi:MAG: NitT/TauT family transport system substrate-binding protein [Acetobacteraceae bacterium]|nr:NitT/TauT family transport system substrate-binding protein [Acetobacteraceae bacterium]
MTDNLRLAGVRNDQATPRPLLQKHEPPDPRRPLHFRASRLTDGTPGGTNLAEHHTKAVPTATRRMMIAAASAYVGLQPARAVPASPEVRLGILQFGTVQWVADVIRRHSLDSRHGFTLNPVTLANTEAGRISLMAGGSDVVVSDWPFVAVQRTAGTKLCFAPFSSSSGGIMTAQQSPIGGLADLRGRKLGVVGGPVDKSWLIVQAAGRATQNIDLAATAEVVFGAPPLLGAKLRQGELDAVLTYWNFAAELESAGFRQAISVAQCATALGISPRMSLVGFVFHEDWANANRAAIDGFLAAVGDAERLLGRSDNAPSDDAPSDDEWLAIRPLMNAGSDALFARLRDRFREGVTHEDTTGQTKAAERMFAVLHDAGGSRATGGIDTLPPGIFWPIKNEAS